MRALTAAVLPLLWAAPAAAQPAGHDHAAHQRGATAAPPAAPADPHAGHHMPAPDPHAGHVTPGAPAPAAPDPHAGHAMPAAAAPAAEGAEPPIPHGPPPPPPTDYAAERYYDRAVMAAARAQLRREHGAVIASKVMANIAEHQARSGEDGYRWDGEAWWGGDIHRFVGKTEGEGTWRGGLEKAEVQALYSRAVTRYFDLQAGVRQDLRPGGRTYLTVGTEGLLPYWFQVEGAVFLSTQGEVLARLQGAYDLRLTQRLILQPRGEANFAAQDTRATRTGSGLSDAELGLRLRYEIRREFAPYLGVSHERLFGRTADWAQAAGEARRSTSVVVGLRAWF